MSEHDPYVELNIEIDEDEAQSATLQTLSSLDLERVVTHTLHVAHISQSVALSLLITGDQAIQRLNKRYRQQDKPTDVLSFPLLDTPLVTAPSDQLWPAPETAETPPIAAFITPPNLPINLGDIVISWPTVLRQASEANHSPIYELLYLLSHGVLHLIGYDDHTEAGYQAMIHIQHTVLEAVGQKQQPQ
jgi:probable rRNA maturation factor